jgi:predicted DNA-binding transcriptional regulator YafY
MPKAARVLALLEALQDHPSLTGPELARQLGVDVRTVRRDVVSLQDLGIPVESERGPAGGYRLRPGYRMPPLMLTAAETTAVALGLLAARRDRLDADGALAKIRRVLPDQVRRRVEALEQTLSFTPTAHEAMPPEGEHLLLLADAARRGRRVRAVYVASDGKRSERELSPYGVVSHRGRWYVPAHDHGRREPRALRADRFYSVLLRGAGRPPPADFDAVDFVSRTLARVPWTHEVEVLLRTPPAEAAARFPPTLAELTPRGDDTLLRMRAESLDWVAGLLAGAGCDFEIRRPDELRASVQALGERLFAASRGLRDRRARDTDLQGTRE